MSTTLKAFENMPSSKESADLMIKKLIHEVKDGAIDPIKMRVFFKHLERVISEVVDACDQEILSAAEKYGERFSLMDAEVQIKVNGSKYAYDLTQDVVLPGLYEQQEALKEKIKTREKFLQAVPEDGLEIVNDETGEMVRVYRPYKSGGKTGLAITIKGGNS
jgi:hypothetical protein